MECENCLNQKNMPQTMEQELHIVVTDKEVLFHIRTYQTIL